MAATLAIVDTQVRFAERDGISSVLEVRHGPSKSALHSLAQLLFELRIQVVRTEAFVTNLGVTERLYLVDFDGAPLPDRRTAKLESEVQEALQLRPPVRAPRSPVLPLRV